MNNNRSSNRNSNNNRHGQNEMEWNGMESHSKSQRRNKQQQHQQPIGTPQNHLTETNRRSVLVFKFLLLNTTVHAYNIVMSKRWKVRMKERLIYNDQRHTILLLLLLLSFLNGYLNNAMQLSIQ
mmetsp:Transcript_52086/g.59069  ORF Transcript_52086/g.59069 Transcript_52086/m.59069 type:complete len:124 (+) Transcript_52086:789-1160(+)